MNEELLIYYSILILVFWIAGAYLIAKYVFGKNGWDNKKKILYYIKGFLTVPILILTLYGLFWCIRETLKMAML
jgi:predicted permease